MIINIFNGLIFEVYFSHDNVLSSAKNLNIFILNRKDVEQLTEKYQLKSEWIKLNECFPNGEFISLRLVPFIRLIEYGLILADTVCFVLISIKLWLRKSRFVKTASRPQASLQIDELNKPPTTISLFKNIKYIDETSNSYCSDVIVRLPSAVKEPEFLPIDKTTTNNNETCEEKNAAKPKTHALFTAIFLRLVFYLPSILIPQNIIMNNYFVWNLFFVSNFCVPIVFFFSFFINSKKF